MATVVETSAYEQERHKPMPSKNHAIVQGNLHFELRGMIKNKFDILPEVSLQLPNVERVPDLAIFEPQSFTPGQDEVRLKEIPQTIIEILSPKQSLADLITKAAEYFTAGVGSYWLVLPDLCSIYVFKAPNDYQVFIKDQTLADPSIGIELPLSTIFS